MSESNPTQTPVESLSSGVSGAVDQHDLEIQADAALDAFAAQFVGADPQNEEPAEREVEESEEVTGEHEELSDDDADVDTPDEADDAEEVEESDQQDEELEIVSYDDLKGYALEIGGENYTAAQLKSMIGRMKSAGKEAREADQALQEANARLEQAQAQEQWIEQRMSAVASSDKMHQLQSQWQKMNEEIARYEEEGDMYEVTLLERKQKRIAQEYHAAKHELETVQERETQKKRKVAREGLESRGLTHLNNDGPETKAWVDYVKSKIDNPAEFQTAALTPSIAEAFEKARKYDASVGKTKGSKLKSSGKTLKSGVNTPAKTPASKRKAEYDANPDAYFEDLARDVLGL